MATTFVTSQAVRPWPAAVCPSEMTLQLRAHTSSFASPFTRTTQTQEMPGGLFYLVASFPPAFGQRIPATRAWMASLRGSTGRFYWPANGTNFRIPSAYASEETTVIRLEVSTTRITVDRTDITIDQTEIVREPVFTPNGTSPDRVRIPGTLWLNSNTVPLQEGAYVSFDDAQGWRHLHIVVGLEHDGDTTTIVVEPPMRFLPRADTVIHVANPSGVFMLKDDEQGSMALRPGLIGQLSTIEATQAFPLRVVV